MEKTELVNGDIIQIGAVGFVFQSFDEKSVQSKLSGALN